MNRTTELTILKEMLEVVREADAYCRQAWDTCAPYKHGDLVLTDIDDVADRIEKGEEITFCVSGALELAMHGAESEDKQRLQSSLDAEIDCMIALLKPRIMPDLTEDPGITYMNDCSKVGYEQAGNLGRLLLDSIAARLLRRIEVIEWHKWEGDHE